MRARVRVGRADAHLAIYGNVANIWAAKTRQGQTPPSSLWLNPKCPNGDTSDVWMLVCERCWIFCNVQYFTERERRAISGYREELPTTVAKPRVRRLWALERRPVPLQKSSKIEHFSHQIVKVTECVRRVGTQASLGGDRACSPGSVARPKQNRLPCFNFPVRRYRLSHRVR